MKGFDLTTPGWTPEALKEETLRVFDVCEGCRRCFNLCPSFETLLNRTDDQDGDVTKLAQRDFADVVNQCFYCKMCWNNCPYTPPHQYEIDFPRLMAAWKTLPEIRKDQGLLTRFRDLVLVETDLIGKLGTRFPGLSNWAMRSGPIRAVLHRLFGIHQDRNLLPFQSPRFDTWFKHTQTASSSPPQTNGKVALFGTCIVNYQTRDIGEATAKVLKKNGVEVVYPEQQCCGMPYIDTGDIAALTKKAEANIAAFLPWIDKGYSIVAPVPTCSLMLKREYPYLLKSDAARTIAEHTYDICEYLMLLHRDGRLSTDFREKPGTIAYQIPCHLRDQNIGFKSRDLMKLTGARVSVIERCSGHDGSWGVKSEYFDMSMNMASRLGTELQEVEPDLIASDCPLSALQITQETGKPVVHPIQVIEKAYEL
ncbi:MAG TPA: Fe-S oxidoreductase [Nitrospirales bacterium]|nr:Fe-S oxidoreductase [Nitrospirales bacterium]HIN32806.1 Fe-S oxidoreductase [Nitrospirales bacterium]HIO21806.1 Fe-S oxidoreductase [Nitrospirales bacterium]